MSVDYPRAWQIAREVEPEYHHNDCSFNQAKGGIICDCKVVYEHPEYLDTKNFYGKDGKIIKETTPPSNKGDE